MAKKRVLCVLAGFCLLLTGCQAVPRSSQVYDGLALTDQADGQVLFDPAGPVPGATPEEIVRGFLAAAAAATDNYAIAREYLAPEYRAHWDPRAGVLIDDGSRTFDAVEDDAGSVKVTPVAQLNAQGYLESLEGTATTQLRYDFKRSAGEWRISAAPAGIVLDRATFSAVWKPYPLAFISDTDTLVWETRWLVNDTSLLRNVLAHLCHGPSAQLAAGARSQLVKRWSLQQEVTVKGTNAVITLENAAAFPAGKDADLLRQQLAATLGQFDAIESFTVVQREQTLLTGKVIREKSPLAAVPFIYADNRVTEFTTAGRPKTHPLSEKIASHNPSALVLHANTAAIQNRDGVRLLTATGQRLVDRRALLLPPTLDAWGFVWTVTKSANSTLRVSTASETEPLEFTLADIDTAQLSQIRVSPDGTRLALLLENDYGTQLKVVGIDRRPDGTPITVDARAVNIAFASGSPRDLDWLDNGRLLFLTDNPTGGKVFLTGPSIFTTERGIVAQAQQLSGADRNANVLLLTQTGRLYRQQGQARWLPVQDNVTLIARFN